MYIKLSTNKSWKRESQGSGRRRESRWREGQEGEREREGERRERRERSGGEREE